MAVAFAKGTDVPVAKTRTEIEALLTRYGATKFGSFWDSAQAVIMCEAKGRKLRFVLPVPDPNSKMFAKTKAGQARNAEQRKVAAAAEERRRWRALLLVLKAKLESVESGIESFESAFLASIVVPGGGTFGEWAIPQIAEAYERGVAIPMLLGDGS
jgi:hypothetical protein